MDLNQASRHFFSIEMSNDDRLETAAILDSLKDSGYMPTNTNLGQFIRQCFQRGLNEHRKDLYRRD